MSIMGVDFHLEFQQIALVDAETGELQEQRLQHPEEAEGFYRELATQALEVRVGMEASGHTRWFEPLLGDPETPEWTGWYVLEVARQARGDRDWSRALDSAEQMVTFQKDRRRILDAGGQQSLAWLVADS